MTFKATRRKFRVFGSLLRRGDAIFRPNRKNRFCILIHTVHILLRIYITKAQVVRMARGKIALSKHFTLKENACSFFAPLPPGTFSSRSDGGWSPTDSAARGGGSRGDCGAKEWGELSRRVVRGRGHDELPDAGRDGHGTRWPRVETRACVSSGWHDQVYSTTRHSQKRPNIQGSTRQGKTGGSAAVVSPSRSPRRCNEGSPVRLEVLTSRLCIIVLL